MNIDDDNYPFIASVYVKVIENQVWYYVRPTSSYGNMNIIKRYHNITLPSSRYEKRLIYDATI
jgi:hypothetical protein